MIFITEKLIKLHKFFQNLLKHSNLIWLSYIALLHFTITGNIQAQDFSNKPNILLIVSEDHGPDLRSYGNLYVQTPNLDQLATEGARFENAFTTNSVCSPSRASLLTGLYPHQHGQIGLATHKYTMYESFENIPNLLKEIGYKTGIIGKLHINPTTAFPFDFSWNNSEYISFANRNIQEIAQQAQSFMGESDQPFFLMVNYPDAHFPLIRQQKGIPSNPLEAENVKTLPFIGIDNMRLRQYTANYYNSIMRLDEGIGYLLDTLKSLGKKNNTLVIFLSDHGAQFSRGKTSSYESALKIPLIIRWPGHIEKGKVHHELVSIIDIFPTILEVLKINKPNLPGESLFNLMNEKQRPWREFLFSGKTGSTPFFYFPQRTVRDSRYKLIVNLLQDRDNPMPDFYENPINSFFDAGTTPEEISNATPKVQATYKTWKISPSVELYDLYQDPYEFVNLADNSNYKEIKIQLKSALKKWQIETDDPLANPKLLEKLTTEMDLINSTFPMGSYNNEPDFEWKYHEYLYDKRTN